MELEIVLPKKQVDTEIVVVNFTNRTNSNKSNFSCDRVLCVLIILSLILAFLLLCAFLYVSSLDWNNSGYSIPSSTIKIYNTEEHKTGPCDTDQCERISNWTIENGNFSLDPCQNFYKYSCSLWEKKNPIPHGQLYYSANSEVLSQTIDERIQEIIHNLSTSSNYSYVQRFYNSCMEFGSTNETEDEILRDILSTTGEYHSEDTWDESQFNLTNLTAKLLSLGCAPLFDVTLEVNPYNRSEFNIMIDLPSSTSLWPTYNKRRLNPWAMFERRKRTQSSNNEEGIHFNLTFAQDTETIKHSNLYKGMKQFLENKMMEQLKKYIMKVGKLLNSTDETIHGDSNEINKFAQTLQLLSPSIYSRKILEQKNKIYNEYDMEFLQFKFPYIEWEKLLRQLFVEDSQEDEYSRNKKLERLREIKIYVAYPDHLIRVFQAIKYANKRILQNFMIISYIRDLHGDLLNNKEKTQSEKTKFCTQSTKYVFPMEMARLFLDSYSSSYLNTVRNDIERIFSGVKSSLLELIQSSNWVESKSTKDEAIRKIKLLKGNFIGPESSYNPLSVSAQINSTDFYINIKNATRLLRKQLFRKIWDPVNEKTATWSFVALPFVVNAFYIQEFNSIVIPLAFLNPPQYYPNGPNYINYATIGLTIAHESLHALDGSGGGFDAVGMLHDWWDENSKKILNIKTSCVAQQYENTFQEIIPYFDKHIFMQVNGKLTQNENIADIAGLQVAYKAYQNFMMTENGGLIEPMLPRLNFSIEQMFFLGAAQTYCTNISPLGLSVLLEIDEHTPYPYRINGMLINTPEFSRAFNCSKGCFMNPNSGCEFW